jgi:hypothetical protein
LHARHNLLGAYYDLKRGENDQVSWNTIERVMGQLGAVEDIIAVAMDGMAPNGTTASESVGTSAQDVV